MVTVRREKGNGRWKPGTVVVEMREGFSRDRTSSTTIGGYSQNQSQGIELDAQREEGCAATKVCGGSF